MNKGGKVSLPERMREAAKVVEEADAFYEGLGVSARAWRPDELRVCAEEMEKRAQHEAMVEELARLIDEDRFDRNVERNRVNPPTHLSMALAEKLIGAGWKKVTDE